MTENNSFYDIYNKYKYLMFSIAMNVLKNSFSAEDAVQEAFMKILGHVDMIDDLDSDRTKRLIITITKNTAIDIYRKQSRQWNQEVNFDNVTNLEYSDLYMTGKSEKFSVIESLPDHLKEILLLKFSVGFSNTEIADILEISEVNVRKRISRARKLLKRNMKERGQSK